VNHCKYGVSCEEFAGQNYISLFWGKQPTKPVRQLTQVELNKLNSLLKENRCGPER
jgi:hypothetical protein